MNEKYNIRRSGRQSVEVLAFFISLSLSNFFGFWYVLPFFSNLYGADSLNLIIIIFSMLLIAIGLARNGAKLRRVKMVKCTLPIVLLFIINLIYCSLSYEQGLYVLLSRTFYLLVPTLLVICIGLYIDSTENCNIFMNALCKYAVILAVLTLIQLFLSNYNIYFWSITSAQFRYGSYRINVGAYLQAFCAIVIFAKFVNTKKKRWLFQYIIIVCSIFFGVKIRALCLYLFLSSIYIFWVKSGRKLNLKKVAYAAMALLVILGILIAYRQQIQSFFSEVGILVRFDGIVFYLDQWLKHPLFGIGNFKPNTDYLLYLDKGPFGNYYHDDVGIIGFLNYFGIVGMALLLKLFVSLEKMIDLKSELRITAKSHLLFVILCCFSLCIIDQSRISILPLVIVECYYAKN